MLLAVFALPSTAFAATELRVYDTANNSETFTETASGRGETAGTWSWDGGNILVLSDYDGGPLRVEGDIIIKLVGENKILGPTDTGRNQYGIYVDEGNLTITSEGGEQGSLIIEAHDVGDSHYSKFGYGGCIFVNGADEYADHGGDLTISNAKVEADWYAEILGGNLMQGALLALGGNVLIEQGAFVDVETHYGDNGSVAAIMASAYNNNMRIQSKRGGTVRIVDSTVEASIDHQGGLGTDQYMKEVGIWAYSNIEVNACIDIVRSTVSPYGGGHPAKRAATRAMFAQNRQYKPTTSYDYLGDGSITIDEESILPPGLYIEDYEYTWSGETKSRGMDAHYKDPYTVTYAYEGDAPADAPAVPESQECYEGDALSVADAPALDGWAFSGWSTGDVEVAQDGSFSMPAGDVVFTGTWEEIPSYTVSYRYEGEAPEGAPALPADQIGYEGDALAVAGAPALDGWAFSGWSTGDVEVAQDGSFSMPAGDVVFTGSWEKKHVQPKKEKEEKPVLPQTGDLPTATLALAGLAGSGFLCFGLTARRKR